MALFNSKREKHLCLLVGIVSLAILATVFTSAPLLDLLADQNIQAVFFLTGMAFTALTIFTVAVSPKSLKLVVVGTLALITIYLMFFLRLGLAERSHLIEFSVLAALVFKALSERFQGNISSLKVAGYSFMLCFLFGILDEGIQYFVPSRVFDPVDILFNGLAITFALAVILILQSLKNRLSK